MPLQSQHKNTDRELADCLKRLERNLKDGQKLRWGNCGDPEQFYLFDRKGECIAEAETLAELARKL